MTGETPPPEERPAEAPDGWMPPASGSDWRAPPGREDERYSGFAPPAPRWPAPSPPAAGDRYGAAPAPLNGKAIASVVLGVCGLVVLPLLASVAAIVLGALARGEIVRRGASRGAGLAQAGIILGGAGIVLWIVLVLALGTGSR